MTTELDFPVAKQRAWEKIERLIDKELETEPVEFQNEIKTIMASTLKENEELFTEDFPYLLALVRDGELESLQNHADADAVEKTRKLIDILGPKIKAIMEGH